MKKLLCGILLFPVLSVAQTYNFYFDFNADQPNPRSVDDYLKWRKRNADVEVTALSGFCDTVDTDAYNRALAMRRIESVLSMLRRDSLKIADTPQVEAVGENFGTLPDAALNRKVEVRFRRFATPPRQAPQAEASVADDTPIAGKFVHAKVGDLIRLHNINFFLNSEKITPDSFSKLEDLLQVMLERPSLRIEIHGHICCNPDINDTKLSYRRAKAIFDYLRGHGIPLNRLGYKGFGSARPIFGIPERNAAEEAANRRVEILIKAI